jgi:hypothetical protein
MLVFKKKILLIACLLMAILPSSLLAQQETTLPYLTWVPQAGYTDLTVQTDHYKKSFSIPVIGSFQVYYFNSAFNYNALVKGNIADPNLVIPKLHKLNQVYAGGSYDIFSMRFRKEKNFYHFSIRDVWTQRVTYTNDLANLLWNGNASYAGKTADLSNTRFSGNYYREVAMAASTSLNDKLIVGVRGKILMGLANVTTTDSETSLYTDPNGLSISGHSQFTLLTSGMVNDDKLNAKNIFGFGNLGLAADIGARYKLNEKVSIACNVNNIGFIHWKRSVKNYRVNGDYTSTGYLMRDSADIADADWQNVIDTLKAVFEPKEDSKAYNSWLTPTIYLSGNYLLRETTTLYTSLAADIYYGLRPTFTLGAVQTFGNTFQVALNYSVMPNNLFNLGGGFVVRGGPVQYYLSCDNLPALFDPYAVKYFNARMGLNFTFGKPE